MDVWRDRWVILTTNALLTFKKCPWDDDNADDDGSEGYSSDHDSINSNHSSSFVSDSSSDVSTQHDIDDQNKSKTSKIYSIRHAAQVESKVIYHNLQNL